MYGGKLTDGPTGSDGVVADGVDEFAGAAVVDAATVVLVDVVVERRAVDGAASVVSTTSVGETVAPEVAVVTASVGSLPPHAADVNIRTTVTIDHRSRRTLTPDRAATTNPPRSDPSARCAWG
jgi:hypothetical protein